MKYFFISLLLLAFPTQVKAAIFVNQPIQTQTILGNARVVNQQLQIDTGNGSRSASQIARALNQRSNPNIVEGSFATLNLEKGVWHFEYQIESQERDGDDEFQIFNGKTWNTYATSSVVKVRPGATSYLSEWRQARFKNRTNQVVFLANDTTDRSGLTYARVRNLRRRVPESPSLFGVLVFGLFVVNNKLFRINAE
jgi:hypothetical protein